MRIQVETMNRDDLGRTFQSATNHIRELAYELQVPDGGITVPRPPKWINGYLLVEYLGTASNLSVEASVDGVVWRSIIPQWVGPAFGQIFESPPETVVSEDKLIRVTGGPAVVRYHPVNRQ